MPHVRGDVSGGRQEHEGRERATAAFEHGADTGHVLARAAFRAEDGYGKAGRIVVSRTNERA